MSDEKVPQTTSDEPTFVNPFHPAGRFSLQEDTPRYDLEHEDTQPSGLHVRYHSAAPSVASRRSTGANSNPDLLTHGASAYASSRKLNMSRSASQVFRRPRPSTMLVDEIPKPWLKYKDPAHRWAKWLFWGFWLCGIAVVVGREFYRGLADASVL
jgi:hypothetical protein